MENKKSISEIAKISDRRNQEPKERERKLDEILKVNDKGLVSARNLHEFLEVGKTYTISVPFDGAMKEALKICGTKSGRDTDKEKEARFKYIPSKEIKTPIVEGCSKYYECKVVFKQEMNLDNMPEDMKNSFYGEGETKHIFYYGEILAQY